MEYKDFLLINAFFQVDTYKGFRYFDTAGEILNELSDRFQTREIGLDSVSVSEPVNPEDHLRELRVSAERIWLHYGLDTPTIELRQELPRLVERIALIMSVGGYIRQGLRTAFFHPVEDGSALVALLQQRMLNTSNVRTEILGDLQSLQLTTQVKVGVIRANLIVSPIIGLSSVRQSFPFGEDRLLELFPKFNEIPDHALLVDIDIYDSRRADVAPVKPLINNALEIVEDRVFPFVRRVIGENLE